MNRSPVTWREAAALIACISAGVALRLWGMASETAWCDEALSAACLPAESFRGYVQCAFERDPTIRLAPLYHLVQFSWSLVFGGTLYSLRMLSVILSAVAMLQIYVLARAAATPAAARWAVILFGLSLFQTYYAQEVRVYALLNVLALASIHGLWAYVSAGSQRGLWVCVAFNAALLLTHSFTVVLILAQGLYVLLCARDWRHALRWIGAHAALAVAFAAWILLLGYDVAKESGAYGGATAGFRELAAMALQFSGARFSNRNPGDYLPGGFNLELPVLALVVGLVGLPLLWVVVCSGRDPETQHRRKFYFMLAIWMIVPVALLFAIGQLWRPCFYPRYLIYSAIPLNILTAFGLAGLHSPLKGRLIAAALVAMLLWQHLALPRPFRADYAAMAAAVMHDTAPEKTVLALKRFNYLAVDYALRDEAVPVELLYGLKETIGIARQRAAEGKSVWVVFYLWAELAPFDAAMADAGLAVRAFQTDGMPGLHFYHVVDGG